ncbi:Transposase IS4 [Popillia japonica]|uniref:Transposase IS4 n=1 Tax=Popillia japonica TaxID=7064 RepID=A0AAW1KL94_POPJA
MFLYFFIIFRLIEVLLNVGIITALNPTDFFLPGYKRAKVYQTQTEPLEDLSEKLISHRRNVNFRGAWAGDDKFEETVLKWFNECKSDESDIDVDVDNDFAIVSGHDTESENSESNDDESDNEVSNEQEKNTNYFGKNDFKWSVNEVVPLRGRTLRHNIVLQLPGLKQVCRSLGNSARPKDVWNLLFSEDMVGHLVQWTNVKIQSYRQKFKREGRSEIADTDSTEIRAFMGMLIYSAVFNSNHESIRTIFATDVKIWWDI